MTKIEGVKIGTLRKILCAFGGKKSHGYDLYKKTGMPLPNVYKLLKILIKVGLVKEVGCEPGLKRSLPKKYVALTENGETLAKIFQKLSSEKK